MVSSAGLRCWIVIQLQAQRAIARVELQTIEQQFQHPRIAHA